MIKTVGGVFGVIFEEEFAFFEHDSLNKGLKELREDHPKSIKYKISPAPWKLTSSHEKWSGRQDLNLRPLTPEASALPG